MKLNLACGSHKREHYINVDKWPGIHPDMVWDLLQFPWPWEKDSVDEIYCGHFVEHIPHGSDDKDLFFQFMDEAYRVLKDGAKMKIRWPCHRSLVAYIEPTHHRFITQLTWRYTDAVWRRAAVMDYYPIECDFSYEMSEVQIAQPAIIGTGHTNDLSDKDKFALTHYWNVLQDEEAVLTCHKPARNDHYYKGP